MTRYFFHSRDGGVFRDEVGTELADDGVARIEATKFMAQLLSENPGAVWNDSLFRVSVTDAAGFELFALSLAALTAGPSAPLTPGGVG